jgi:hypothetical protein
VQPLKQRYQVSTNRLGSCGFFRSDCNNGRVLGGECEHGQEDSWHVLDVNCLGQLERYQGLDPRGEQDSTWVKPASGIFWTLDDIRGLFLPEHRRILSRDARVSDRWRRPCSLRPTLPFFRLVSANRFVGQRSIASPVKLR